MQKNLNTDTDFSKKMKDLNHIQNNLLQAQNAHLLVIPKGKVSFMPSRTLRHHQLESSKPTVKDSLRMSQHLRDSLNQGIKATHVSN